MYPAQTHLAVSGAAGTTGGVTSSRVSAELEPVASTRGASRAEESSARRRCAGAVGGSAGGGGAVLGCWASLPAAATAADRRLGALLGLQARQEALESAAMAAGLQRSLQAQLGLA